MSDPSNDVNSCEDFFLLVVTAYILAAAMEILGMQSLSDTPDETLMPPSATSKEEKAAAIKSVGKIIIQEFVDLKFHKERPKAMEAAGGKQPQKAV